MRKLSNSTILLLVGIVIFLVGCIQPSKYEDAKENGYKVDATIVEIKSREDPGIDGAPDTMEYTIYGDYEIDGKKYEHVKIATHYDSCDCKVGDTIEFVANPDSPDEPMFEGGVLCVIGFLIACAGLISKMKRKKKA